ncbi:MIP transporter [Aspergillus terreus]|uniref:MIP transporter n=1 Tax=Aspergillus terreus TaxID=33178 RepID=A0A5M3YX96_ASPTE|nr:hypothetical protein ATETN484_0004002300 [Aspergillus terreus]GFF12913.1 MIP transporter [Aspergillus terreus]
MVVDYLPEYEVEEHHHPLQVAIPPFAGRVGRNQDFIVDRNDPRNTKVLEKVPDAAPHMTLAEVFDFRGFLSADFWKWAMLECVASMMNVFITAWVTTHPPAPVTAPKTELGIYHTLTFFSPLFGGITNLLLTPLLIYTFSPSSGGHISPTITMATFFARIISFPRMILYLAGQTFGGALAGFALNSAAGQRRVDHRVLACLILIFLAFGVALDPRQAKIFGHATSPWFVGIVLGIVSWGTAWTRPGYIGASVNPARCFGVYVASHFPGYHWIH